MTTCFILTERLDEDAYLSVCLDQQGEVVAPLLTRPIEELKVLQKQARTVIVLPTHLCSLHEIELPLLMERKARAAIPYALEEQLAQSVTSLHFAFDRQFYQDNRYLVVVMDKLYIAHVISTLKSLDLDFDEITVDWFALHPAEAAARPGALLVNDPLFKGALRGDLATLYLNNPEKTSTLLAFNDSLPSVVREESTQLDEPSALWIVRRLSQARMMNICQGEFQHDTKQKSLKQWYSIAASLVGVSVVCWLVLNGLYLHTLNTHIEDLDKKIAVVYQQFFPEAKQVISPKFRVEQLLKAGNTANQSGVLWTLMDKFSQAFKPQQSTVQQIHFQNQTMSVTLVAKDFAALETLQQRLQQQQIKVTQAQASSEKHHVLATLELSL